MTHTHLVLIGTSLLGLAGGVVGVFAVLRRQALLGDVLAHATMPGLALAFLAVGSKNMESLLLGACVACAAAGGMLWVLGQYTRLKADVRLGVVLSVFFGVGMAILGRVQDVPGGSQAGLESYLFGKPAGMLERDLLWLIALASLCVLVIAVVYKELKLVAFDSQFAQAQGWPTGALDLLLVCLVVLVVVIGLPVVGVVMVSALLILPPATARFWTDRLSVMLILAGMTGASMGVIGTLASAEWIYLPAGPTIMLTGAILFGLSFLGAPKRGLVSRLFRRSLLVTRGDGPRFEP